MKIGDYNSLFTTNALSRTQSAIARSLQRLSTGLRVNSPQDDMAAFSEGVSLDSSIRGYSQAIRNLNDATGVLNTASSAISTQIEIVQKLRELAVQASNGTLSSADRANLNTEAQALYQEFTRITSTTQFNGINLLDGSFGTQTLQAGTAAGDNFSVQIPSLQGSTIFQKTIGTGQFGTSRTIPESNDAFANWPIAVTDLNGDGVKDIVTGSFTGQSVLVYYGNPNGTYSSAATYNVGQVQDVVVGDINGDGISDIVAATKNNSIELLIGKSDGTFRPGGQLDGGTWTRFATIADVNGDGKADIVSTGFTDGSVDVLLGNGDGTFKSKIAYTVSPGQQLGVAVADMNGDGKLDIVTGDQGNGNISVLLGNGDGTFKSPLSRFIYGGGGTFMGPSSVIVADVNHDGIPDVLTANNGNTANNFDVLIGKGDGTFSSVTNYTTDGQFPFMVSAGDLNGDGNLDFVTIPNSGNINIFYGNANGTFSAAVTKAVGAAADWNAIADMNNDGIPDILAAQDQTGPISIFYQGTESVSAVSNISLATQSAAQALLPILDNGLTSLKADQVILAASQVRLGEANSYSANMVQNLSDARSSALNVDIAAETSQLVRNQILEQAQVAVVGQANLNMQLVLGLLKNL